MSTPSIASEKARARDLIFPDCPARCRHRRRGAGPALSAAESIGLLQALAVVPDPRQRRGRRHSLQSILFLALGAFMAGARSYAAIADWAVAGEHEVSVCGEPPHASTDDRAATGQPEQRRQQGDQFLRPHRRDQ